MTRQLSFLGLVALAACATPDRHVAAVARADTVSTVGRALSPDDTLLISERDTVPVLTTTIAMGSIGDGRLTMPAAGAPLLPAAVTDSTRKCAKPVKRAGTPS